MADLKAISASRATKMVRDGAVLVDIRERDEHHRERIPGSRHHALSMIDASSPARLGDEVLIFYYASGARTKAYATKLAASAPCEVYILDGGIGAWKRAGLPVATGP